MKEFTVKIDNAQYQTVIADYFRIECGIVTFRRLPRDNEQYPVALHVFAPGRWVEIVEGQEVVEKATIQQVVRLDANIHRRFAMLDIDDDFCPEVLR